MCQSFISVLKFDFSLKDVAVKLVYVFCFFTKFCACVCVHQCVEKEKQHNSCSPFACNKIKKCTTQKSIKCLVAESE